MVRNIEKIILAAGEAPQPFSVEQLTVAVWENDPHLFGLKGFEKVYPNNHAVLSALSGKKGLVSRGYLDRVGKGSYQIGNLGREEIKRLSQSKPQYMSQELIATLGRLLSSVAWRRFKQGKVEYLSLTDAKDFLNIDTKSLLAMMRKMTARKPAQLSNGQVIDKKLIVELDQCDDIIRSRFGRLLETK